MLGPEHPSTLRSTLALAATLTEQNKFDEALIIRRQCYSGVVKVRGTMQPTTVAAASNLAITLANLGHYVDCKGIYRSIARR